MSDSSKYNIPNLKHLEYHQAEIVIKKSRFIASVGHVASVDEAKEFIAHISNLYKDARHNCYAFNVGVANSSAFVGLSDDGEPHGTAGAPMLNVLLHCDIGEIAVVVTRYFGGILLGTGGLVKAYQDATKLALEDLPLCIKEDYINLKLSLDHQYINNLIKLKSKYQFNIDDLNYEAKSVIASISIIKTHYDLLLKELQAISKGRIKTLKV